MSWLATSLGFGDSATDNASKGDTFYFSRHY